MEQRFFESPEELRVYIISRYEEIDVFTPKELENIDDSLIEWTEEYYLKFPMQCRSLDAAIDEFINQDYDDYVVPRSELYRRGL